MLCLKLPSMFSDEDWEDNLAGDTIEPTSTLTSTMDQYERVVEEEELGEGGYGHVTLVRRLSDGGLFACKSMWYPSLSFGENCKYSRYQEYVNNEVKIHRVLGVPDHEYITQYVDHWFDVDAQRCNVVMEYASGGTVSDLVHKARCDPDSDGLDEDTVRKVLLQIGHALHQCHTYVDPTLKGECSILHGDLKPHNILVMGSDDEQRFKLADFGLATKLLPGQIYHQAKRGTLFFQAPEMLTAKLQASVYSDMYALGCILYEMCTLKEYIDMDNASEVSPATRRRFAHTKDRKVQYAIVKRILDRKPEPAPLPKRYSQWLISWIQRMLSKDRTQRPTTHDLMDDPEWQAQFIYMRLAEKHPTNLVRARADGKLTTGLKRVVRIKANEAVARHTAKRKAGMLL